MFQVINDLIRNLAQDALSSVRRMLKSQFQTALLVEEARHIAELREQAKQLEREGHEDLAALVRSRADAKVSSLEKSPVEMQVDDEFDFSDDPKAKTVFASNVIASGTRPLLDGDAKKSPAKRGRPRKIRPDSSADGDSTKPTS